jgi:NAD(P)-dependent dehydrogenase (short-subunit alcohol dehydrogenase family)
VLQPVDVLRHPRQQCEGDVMAHRVDGKVVVITGASAGVGRAAAVAFAERGCRVGLLARGRDRLESAAREVRERGGEAIAYQADVSDPQRVEAAADYIEGRFGPIDIWVNNAMLSVFSPVSQMKAEEYRRVTEVTYLGYIHGTLAALKRMLPRDRGIIVQVGSALAYRGIPLQSAYCGAKHAIQGFTDSLRTELLHDGSNVRVTEVHLSAMNTPQFRWVKSRLPRKAQPVPPIFQPELAADAIIFAAEHPHRREIHVGFPAAKVIWGNKLLPKLADHYLARTGYQAQQGDEPEDEDRPDNLWEPPPGDPGAHGVFDERARSFSLQYWWTKHRGMLLTAAGSVALAGLAALLAPRPRNGGLGDPGERRQGRSAWRRELQEMMSGR